MRTARILFILGIWIAILPYLGFPMFWKNILLLISGLVVAYEGYRIYRQMHKEEHYENFTENQELS